MLRRGAAFLCAVEAGVGVRCTQFATVSSRNGHVNVAFCVHAIWCPQFSSLTAPNAPINVAFCVHATRCTHFSTLMVPKSLVNVAFCGQAHFVTVTSENDRVNVAFCGHAIWCPQFSSLTAPNAPVNVAFCVHRPSARPRHIQKLAAPPPETGSSTCGLVTLSITLQLFARVPPATRKTN